MGENLIEQGGKYMYTYIIAKKISKSQWGHVPPLSLTWIHPWLKYTCKITKLSIIQSILLISVIIFIIYYITLLKLFYLYKFLRINIYANINDTIFIKTI